MALNAATIAAIVVAVWAHPQGVSYLEKIDRLYACPTANPCCQTGGGGGKWQRPISIDSTDQRIAEQIDAEDEIMLAIIIQAVTKGII